MDAMTNTDPTSATTPGTANIDATCARLETQVTESMARTKSEAETVKARWEADQKRLKRKLNMLEGQLKTIHQMQKKFAEAAEEDATEEESAEAPAAEAPAAEAPAAAPAAEAPAPADGSNA